MKPYKDWTKAEVLSYYIKVYPPIDAYKKTVTWTPSTDGWHPHFTAPTHIIQEMTEALQAASQ